MRHPPPLAALLLLSALSGPAGAQVNADAASAANAGQSGVAGAGAVSAAGVSALPSAARTPSLSLTGPSAALSAPLAPAAKSAALPASAIAAARAAPAAAAAPERFPDAAAAPPAAPSSPDAARAQAAAAPVRTGALAALERLGVPDGLAGRLQVFLLSRQPDGRSLGRSEAIADISARAIDGADVPDARKVLLILTAALMNVDPDRAPGAPPRAAATADYLAADRDAAALIADFGARYGFTAAQVRALVLATDFDADPAALKAKREAAAKALQEAFPGEDFGARWGESLALFAARDKPEIWAAPAAPAPARAPPVSAEVAAARAYVDSIASGFKLDDKRYDALLGLFFEENGIAPGSRVALSVRQALVPGRVAAEGKLVAGLDPALSAHRAELVRIAAERGTTPAAIQAVLVRRGLLGTFVGLKASFSGQVERALFRDELERAVARYPETAAGDLMKQVADAMATPSGKSVEEVARDGVFVYADFYGSGAAKTMVSRDPDVRSYQIAFYVTRRGGRWKIDGYRQNRRTGRSDASFEASLKQWLVAGGVPAQDLE